MAINQIRIANISKQMVPIQLRSPNGDFYTHEHQIRLDPGCQPISIPKSHLFMEQITNLAKRGILKIVNDTEKE